MPPCAYLLLPLCFILKIHVLPSRLKPAAPLSALGHVSSQTAVPSSHTLLTVSPLALILKELHLFDCSLGNRVDVTMEVRVIVPI